MNLAIRVSFPIPFNKTYCDFSSFIKCSLCTLFDLSIFHDPHWQVLLGFHYKLHNMGCFIQLFHQSPCLCKSTPLFNSLAPGRLRCCFKTAIFNLVLLIGIFTSSKNNALRWMPRALTDDQSTLVQVMAWWRQATSHYLSQCWPSSMCHMASPVHSELTRDAPALARYISMNGFI